MMPATTGSEWRQGVRDSVTDTQGRRLHEMISQPLAPEALFHAVFVKVQNDRAMVAQLPCSVIVHYLAAG